MRKKRHTGRNLTILGFLVAVAVITVALSGAFTPETPAKTPPTFALFVHVYDQALAPTWQDIKNQSQLVANVTVSVSGSNGTVFTHITPTGIISPDPLPAGTYQVTVSKEGYTANPVTYVLGPNCADKTPDGNCHVYIPMTKKTT